MLAHHTITHPHHLHQKEALRTHVDQWPLVKQMEFIRVASQLVVERPAYQEPEVNPSFREFLRAAMD